MIPLLKENHKHVYIDSSLFNLDVIPYVPPDPSLGDSEKLMSVITYLSGIATVNNLTFENVGVNVYLKGGDFPKAEVMSLGFLDQKTQEQYKALQWDFVKVAGRHLIEVPKAHEDYIQEIANVPRSPFSLQFIIANYQDDLEVQSGVSLGGFVDLNINSFDAIYSGNVSQLLKSYPNKVGFNVFSRPYDIKTALQSSSTTQLSGLIGDISKISISDEIPYKVSEVVGNGLQVRSQVQFIQAGFSIMVDTAELPQGIIFDFTIENSKPDFSRQVDGLPLVSRRQFQARKLLNVGDSVEIARIKNVENTKRSNGLPFFKKFRNRNNSDSSSTITVLVKRTM